MLGTIDDETRVGLFLNRDRQQLRRANEIAIGIGAAIGGKLEQSWFRALHDDDATADLEFQRYEANRLLDEALNESSDKELG